MWQLSRQNINRQMIGRNFFETEYLPYENKRILKQDLCLPRRTRYQQANCARDTTKLDFIMNQGTSGVQ